MDKIGEVIGPKGKVINALQQETGADIAVDDDGMVGTVTIGAKDGTAVEEARRRISTILDPPLAEVGATYQGKVVNITKFGAFVNILPGRDGLLHISKIGQGKRVERVEDVLELGQPVEVKVDDIDPQGKVSLSLAGEAPAGAESGGGDRSGRGDGGGRGRSRGDHADPGDRPERSDRGRRPAEASPAPSGAASFEEAFEVELVEEFGDLGPSVSEPSDRPSGGGGGGRGGRRRR
jgi:polyribonucleotide nucleotidyltransferase